MIQYTVISVISKFREKIFYADWMSVIGLNFIIFVCSFNVVVDIWHFAVFQIRTAYFIAMILIVHIADFYV